MRLCSIRGCGRKHSSRGYCSAHYERMRREGHLPRRQRGECSVPGCTGKLHAHGYCGVHNQRMRRYGRLERILAAPRSVCSFPGCTNKHTSGGYCRKHYDHSRRVDDPAGAYRLQRKNAKQRGVPFRFTFEQWWAEWEPYWHLRGHRLDQYCMARIGDRGAYEVGNVKIITNRENRQEQAPTMLGRRLSAEARAKISAAGKGRRPSLETRAKISAARKRYFVKRASQ